MTSRGPMHIQFCRSMLLANVSIDTIKSLEDKLIFNSLEDIQQADCCILPVKL